MKFQQFFILFIGACLTLPLYAYKKQDITVHNKIKPITQNVLGNSDSDISSSAYQFNNFINYSVNPRTGTVNISFDLVHVIGNQLQGPSLDIKLIYSMSNKKGYYLSGFNSWDLNLPYFDIETDNLVVSGNSYKVLLDNSLQYHKTKEFLFNLNGGSPIVILKNGTEYDFNWLGDIQTISDAQGRSLHFYYNNGSLTSITDDQGNTLANFQGTSSQTIAVSSPGVKKNIETNIYGGSTGPDNAEINSIQLGNYVFQFDYKIQSQQAYLLNQMTLPLGASFSISYLNPGLGYISPDGQIKYTPAVSQTELKSNDSSAIDEVKTYNYGQFSDPSIPYPNYLGFNSQIPTSKMSDSLFDTPNTYIYKTSVTDSDGTKEIYTYNHFHLELSDTIEDSYGDILRQTTYQYPPWKDIAYENLTPEYGFPLVVSEKSYDFSSISPSLFVNSNQGISGSYETSIQRTYDAFGNVISDTAKGITKKYEYYSGNENSVYAGMESILKKVTVSNGKTTDPQFFENYNFNLCPNIQGKLVYLPQSETQGYIDKGKATTTLYNTYAVETDPQKINFGFVYSSQINAAPKRNLKQSSQNAYVKVSNFFSKKTLTKTKDLAQDYGIEIGKSVTGQSENTGKLKSSPSQVSEIEDAFTGQILSKTNSLGARLIYSYDNLNRITAIETQNGENIQTTNYCYYDPATDSKKCSNDLVHNQLVITFPNGYEIRYFYNSLGYTMEIDTSSDQGKTFEKKFTLAYNPTGFQIAQKQWISPTQALTTQFYYNLLGQQIATKAPDETGEVSFQDYVHNRNISYQYNSNNSIEYISVSQNNTQGLPYAYYKLSSNPASYTKPLETELENLEKSAQALGKLPSIESIEQFVEDAIKAKAYYSSSYFHYDSWNRLINYIDTDNQITKYSYNLQGQQETMEYPDGLTIKKSYDPLTGSLTGIQSMIAKK